MSCPMYSRPTMQIRQEHRMIGEKQPGKPVKSQRLRGRLPTPDKYKQLQRVVKYNTLYKPNKSNLVSRNLFAYLDVKTAKTRKRKGPRSTLNFVFPWSNLSDKVKFWANLAFDFLSFFVKGPTESLTWEMEARSRPGECLYRLSRRKFV